MRDGRGLNQNRGSQGPGKWVDSRDVYRVESTGLYETEG